jgi:spore germination cell wall hydrolase CwlJ-like protein
MMMTPLLCLATAVYFEARGENHMGQMAVAQVVVNRMHDDRYPDTICGVVWEPKAFSFTHDGKSDRMKHPESRSKALQVAKATLDGEGLGITSTHYHTVSIKVYWSKHYQLDGRVDGHYFYTNDTPYK